MQPPSLEFEVHDSTPLSIGRLHYFSEGQTIYWRIFSMAKKRKIKKPEKEVYRVEIENWEVDHALIGRRKNDFYGDAMFGESSYLMMYGKIIWPEGKGFSRAQIFLNSKAEFDDHWKGEDGKEESTVGFMQLSRDKGTLHMTVDLPAPLFSRIQVSLAVW